MWGSVKYCQDAVMAASILPHHAQKVDCTMGMSLWLPEFQDVQNGQIYQTLQDEWHLQGLEVYYGGRV